MLNGLPLKLTIPCDLRLSQRLYLCLGRRQPRLELYLRLGELGRVRGLRLPLRSLGIEVGAIGRRGVGALGCRDVEALRR